MPDTTTELKQLQLKRAIKELLKRKSHTYTDLAELLECSVPTAKRIMNKEELTLSRLLKICDWLDVSLKQLEEVAEQTHDSSEYFTKEQEDFFVDHPHFLSYFRRLSEGMTPKEIAKDVGLSDLSNQRYLLGIEKLGLIHTTATGRIALNSKCLLRLRPHGKLAKTHFERIVDSSASFFKKHLSDIIFSQTPAEDQHRNASYLFSGLQLSRTSCDEYIARIGKLREDFKLVSENEKRVLPKSKLLELVAIIGHAVIEPENKALPRQLDTFGEIIEL